MNIRIPALACLALVTAGGCLSGKTESEVKPIHITMDVNLKVDREIDKAFANESMAKPKGDFAPIKEMLDRKVAGVNRLSMLEARSGATDDDKISIAEFNSRKLKRLNELAKESGVSLEAVQKRSARRFAEKVPAGSGVWLQAEDGSWTQR